jgi:hypothetical protein
VLGVDLRTVRPSHVYAVSAAAFVLLVGFEGARMAAGHDPALAAKAQPAQPRDDDAAPSDGGFADPGIAPDGGGGVDPDRPEGGPDGGGAPDGQGGSGDSGGASQLPDTRQS